MSEAANSGAAAAAVSGTAAVRAAFARAKAERRAALVAYLTAGDPDPTADVDLLLAAQQGGADLIEWGVPYSDPSADGPTIQRAMERALARGAGLHTALDAVAGFRARGGQVPVVLFGYYNPVFVTGVDVFAERAARAGVSAVLTVDVPVEELPELAEPLRRVGVGTVPLCAPTSTPDRVKRLAALEPAFVYYISVAGVTGHKAVELPSVERLQAVRAAANAPVAVGFGIRTPADAARVAAIADGVVVGSALIDAAHAAAAPHGDRTSASSAAAANAVVAQLTALRAAMVPGGS